MKSRALYVRINENRFTTIELSEPSGDWFTDGHLQEILVAFADSFSSIYKMTQPKVFRTPRCTFSVLVCPKTFRAFCFKPNGEHSFNYLSSIPKTFFIRVLGRSDVAEILTSHANLDSALRLVPEQKMKQNMI